MILPTSYSGAILCLLLSLVCLGSWANLQKRSGKWRYELFYFDFAAGFALAAIVAAFTLGSLKSSELTLQDNLLISSYHKISYALGGGLILNLGTLLLVAALSVAPMAIVFPVAMGVGLVVGVGWSLFPPQGSVLLPLGGAVLVLIAIVVGVFAYSTYAQERRMSQKPFAPDPRAPGASAAKQPVPATGVALSVVSGIFMGMVPPLSDMARTGEDGLGAYTIALIFALTALGSTFVFAPFFITFAVQGSPVQLRAYFKGGAEHLYGLFAGAVWCAGLTAAFASGGSVATIQADPVAIRGFSEGSAVLASLWGLLVWREFQGGALRVRILLTAMLILWGVGAAMVAMAPGFSR